MNATAISSAPPFPVNVRPTPLPSSFASSAPERPSSSALQSNPPFPVLSNRFSKRSILLVEDDPTIRMFVHRILSNCGFHVDIATNGQEGWEALQNRSYDLLLTDHEMPVLTGLALIDRVRQEEIPIRVILMSGVITTGAVLSTDRNVPDAFLQKPFSIIALVTEIENQLLTEE